MASTFPHRYSPHTLQSIYLKEEDYHNIYNGHFLIHRNRNELNFHLILHEITYSRRDLLSSSNFELLTHWQVFGVIDLINSCLGEPSSKNWKNGPRRYSTIKTLEPHWNGCDRISFSSQEFGALSFSFEFRLCCRVEEENTYSNLANYRDDMCKNINSNNKARRKIYSWHHEWNENTHTGLPCGKRKKRN